MNHSDPAQAGKLWKLDNVHFTAAGSDLVGKFFYRAMLNFSYGLVNSGTWRREDTNVSRNDISNIDSIGGNVSMHHRGMERMPIRYYHAYHNTKCFIV